MPLRDREGMGKRMRREERKRGEGGIDRMRSNNGKQMEKKRKDSTHKGEGSNALYSCFRTRRMKTKSKDLSFIHGPFEGRLNPKNCPKAFLPSTSPCWPTA